MVKLLPNSLLSCSQNRETERFGIGIGDEQAWVTNMASSSSSSSAQEKHDVFLSFRGEDTRFGFTKNLYHALRGKNIQTYMDDQKLESGHEISPQLMEAIKESKICIIVLSKNFASSTWCLNELVHILECKGNENVIPIFYDIDPSIVRKLSDIYGEAFVKHKQNFKDKKEKVEQWRRALENLANLCGYHSKNFGDEHELVNKIAKDILLKLPKYQLTNYGDLIGIEEPLKEIESLLSNGQMDVRIIGIWGMGGIGKTTLASIVFQRWSYSHFDGYCFLEDTPEEADNTNHLRYRLLFALLKDKTLLSMNTPDVGSTLIQNRLLSKKVFIVLDNLNGRSSKLIDLLEGYQLGIGSRIIVTSRDKQLLVTKNCQIYQLKGLYDHDALQLFRFHAFGSNSLATGYEALLESVAHYAKGNPLALKVLGSSLKYKSVEEWKSALDKLKTDPDPEIKKVLRISYDGLGDKSIQGIFLDIACFFNNQVPREEVESISNHATIGISVLIDKSLIISEWYRMLRMHDLLRQMARAIVCDESRDCGNRSRLWNNKDSCHVLERNTGTSAIEGILLDLSQLRKDVKVTRTAFSKMFNLRLLKLHLDKRFPPYNCSRYPSGECNFRVSLSDGVEPFVSDDLKYFQWDTYPLKYLPYFNPENLVQLIMRESQLELLWNEDQPLELVKLKKIDLSYSEHLMQIPNLSRAINLEVLNLQSCSSLVQLPSFFQNLGKLQFLHLQVCYNLEDGLENLPINVRELYLDRTAIKSLPESIWKLKYLERLDLSFCRNLRKIPEILCHMKFLVEIMLYGTEIEELPKSIDNLTRLKTLCLACNKIIKFLPNSLCKLLHLQELYLRECSSLEELPPLPRGLRKLDIGKCERLKSLPELPSSLDYLCPVECSSLEELPPLPRGLRKLNIGKCERLKSIAELPSSLFDLCAKECSSLEELPPLPHDLGTLNIVKCERLKSLPELPSSLNYLRANECLSIEELPPLPHCMVKLNIRKCERLKSIAELPSSLYCLFAEECSSLEELPPLPHDLGTLNIGKCERLKSLPELPSSLYDLCAEGCSSLEELPPLPHHLRQLNIGKCKRLKSLPELPSSLYDLCAEECSSLEELPPLPHSLHILNIGKWERLKSLPELPSSLKVLKANDCTSLEAISSWGYATAQKKFYEDPFFSFENCIKLDDNTLNNVIANHVHHQVSSAEDDTLYVYPGDEIPEWFSYQTGGQDSISIHLPPNWFKLGLRFAICFVYVVLNGYYDQLIEVEYEFNFKANTSNGGDELLYKHGGELTRFLGRIIDSDHVSIVTQPHNRRGFFWPISDGELLEVFGPNWSSICRNITEASFRVFHEDQNGVIMNIKKFGIHPLNNGFEEPNVDGDSTSKRGFGECSSDQPNGYQHNHDSHPHNISK
ncbi:TMV resistance protein N-like isoform X2 [Ziziphus jujuba]|uniref:ADP-ribosyl cyclase/cyclic ADP-ribose hydrolase n=1 Tax=Ziziphus jujuba TaxID=326968 RepID=A0ABM3ZZS3_ZIZJJ|nr:TMV resistance protein N-like isoform X2 [Ziziphus jujuba]